MEVELLDEDLHGCCQTFPVELVDDADPMPNDDDDDQDVIVDVDDEKETESDLEDEDEENEDHCSILGTHLKSKDIPLALYEIKKYMINGNLAKSHAFNPKTDYINSMDLEVKVKMAEVLDIITPQVLDTSKLIGIYRQSVVDLNPIRMAFLGSFKATNSGSSGQLYIFPPSDNCAMRRAVEGHVSILPGFSV
jgi:hypothetical protein